MAQCYWFRHVTICQAKSVLNPDDSIMTVREALIEINYALDEYLSKEESEMDNDSRFKVTFFESFGYSERPFGDAEGLAKARNLSVRNCPSRNYESTWRKGS